VKYLLAATLLLLPISQSGAQSPTTDVHLRETGTKAICLRSAFAHGYRHGYEEGYHMGNIDINMGRHPRAKSQEFHGIPSGYTSEFGPKKSFDTGFQDGLKAGYRDGFAGRKFRAVANLRLISNTLTEDPMPADPLNIQFDQGVSAGYSRGFSQAQQDHTWEELSLGSANCGEFRPASQKGDVAVQASFCDGFRRGYELGRDDGIVLSPDGNALAAKN